MKKGEKIMDKLQNKKENKAGILEDMLSFIRYTPNRCCFSERMRKLFRKNEKNVLRFCNKKAKEKRRLQRVKKPM